MSFDKIHCGDNCDLLGQLPRECIDLVVTSPPYDDLRTYGGHSWDFFGVAWQLKRVLKPGGVIVWVVADATNNGTETGTSFEQALHFKKLGLNLHDTMIYKKAGGSPNTHHPRYTHCFEYMFVFTAGTPKTFNAARMKRNSTAGAVVPPKRKMQRNGEIKAFDVETTITPEYSIDVNVWEYLVGKASGDEGMGEHSAYFRSGWPRTTLQHGANTATWCLIRSAAAEQRQRQRRNWGAGFRAGDQPGILRDCRTADSPAGARAWKPYNAEVFTGAPLAARPVERNVRCR